MHPDILVAAFSECILPITQHYFLLPVPPSPSPPPLPPPFPSLNLLHLDKILSNCYCRSCCISLPSSLSIIHISFSHLSSIPPFPPPRSIYNIPPCLPTSSIFLSLPHSGFLSIPFILLCNLLLDFEPFPFLSHYLPSTLFPSTDPFLANPSPLPLYPNPSFVSFHFLFQTLPSFFLLLSIYWLSIYSILGLLTFCITSFFSFDFSCFLVVFHSPLLVFPQMFLT